MWEWIINPENIGVGILASIAGIIGFHIRWLRGTESIEERKKYIRDDLEDLEFDRPGDKYIIRQVDYINERSSLLYQIKKLVPYFRRLCGSVTVTVKSEGFPGREYVWEDEEYAIDFQMYLNTECPGEFPDTEVIDFELHSSPHTDPKIRICIHSLDPNEISKVIEQIPNFQRHYFSNYVGDGRYMTG